MQKLFNEIHIFLNTPKTVYIIGKSLKEKIDKSLCGIHKIFNEENNSSAEIDFYSILTDSLKELLIVTVQSETTEEFKRFLSNYCTIVLFWNEKYFDNENIKNICEHLLRFKDDNLFVEEFFGYFNEVTSFLNHASVIDILSFKLSDHYFNILCEE